MKKNFYILIVISLFIASCDIKEEGISDERILEASSTYGTQLITNYDVPLKAEFRSGNDLTSSATFYINGQALNSNIARFSQAGTYQITASVSLDGQNYTTQPYQVNVIAPQHSTKILVEDYTGTWCTNCPRVTFKLEQAVSQNNHIIPVAIHYSRWAGDDPLGFDDVETLYNDYNIQAFPSPLINRIHGNIWDENYSSLENELNKSQPLGLSINSNINGNNLSLDISVRFDMNISQKNLNLIIYLVENGLHADQANSTQYYGGQDPIPDFEHNHTLRTALNGLYGASIPSSEAEANHIFTYHLDTDIPNNVSDINQCDIIAFVTEGDPQNTKLINIQKAPVGSQQDFD